MGPSVSFSFRAFILFSSRYQDFIGWMEDMAPRQKTAVFPVLGSILETGKEKNGV